MEMYMNVYGIGFVISCMMFLLVFRGIVLGKYVWDKGFWTDPYKTKDDKASVCSASLTCAFCWPLAIPLVVVACIAEVIYLGLYKLIKKLP